LGFEPFHGLLYKSGMSSGQPKRLLDEVREVMRVRRYVKFKGFAKIIFKFLKSVSRTCSFKRLA
jgi:hypothetical protein